MVNAVAVPTSAAPIGPSKTTDARVADVLAVQENRWGVRVAGADSQIRNNKVKMTNCDQTIPANCPVMMTHTPPATTAAT
jgi:hypothetical protein